MGIEIDRETFSDEEYRDFEQRLRVCLEVLQQLLERPGFGEGEATLGAELEVSLVDELGRPRNCNREVVGESLDPRLTVELNRFNLESNLRFGRLAGRPFAFLADEMRGALDEMTRAAKRHDADVAMIGILPTLLRSDLEGGAMTESPRYRALSTSLRRLRREPFHLRIRGEDTLDLHCSEVTFEGAATSLQLHLRVPPSRFSSIYNAIQLATPAVLAVAGNSPIFLGKRLWDETRVALFKQAVDARPGASRGKAPARVSFGDRWVSDGALELFRESVERHPVLLPVMNDEEPRAIASDGGVPALLELRLHQGTVWRWNRPVYDPAHGGHLRVELRALPAGPTVDDMVANTAFHIGLAIELAEEIEGWTDSLPFETVHNDFYRAASEGLHADLHGAAEPGAPAQKISAAELVETLLPRAQAGLDRAGVARDDADQWLAIIERRTRRSRTGARWQRLSLAAMETTRGREEALQAMFAEYRRHSESGAPVDSWPEPGA